MKKLIFILCFLFVGCCPFCNSDCFYTIEKFTDVDAVGKYRDMHYYLNGRSYDFVKDSVQEMYYDFFCLYIDSLNTYNLSMPVSVDAYITHNEMTEKVDSSLVEYRTVIHGMLGIFVNRRMPEPSSRLKIVVKKDGEETVFEFDITHKPFRTIHSKKWLRFIAF